MDGAGIMCGGWSETQDATKDIQKTCDQVKGKVEEKTGKNYAVYKATKYRSQIVQGENFVIKVHVGGVNYDHLSVFQRPRYHSDVHMPLPELRGVLQHMTKDSPLEPFTN